MNQLKIRQVCLFIIALLPVTKFFMMFSVVAEQARNDMCLSLLINMLLDYITVVLVLYVYKKTNMKFVELLKSKFGEKGTKCILAFYLIYFVIKALLPISEQKDYIVLTLYITFPSFLYFIPFFFVSYYVCSQKLQILGRLSDLLWLMMLLGYIMLIALSIANADFGAIFPIARNNASGIIKGSFKALNWFGDGVYLLFLIGEFKMEKKFRLKILISYAISFMLVLIFAFLFYCIFVNIAFRQRFALTEVSKYSTVISNTGRFDYVGILLILFVNIFSLCLPLFFACRVFKLLFNIQKNWVCSVIINSLVFVFMLISSNSFYYIEQFILNYLGYFFLALANAFPVLLFIISNKRKKELQNEIY